MKNKAFTWHFQGVIEIYLLDDLVYTRKGDIILERHKNGELTVVSVDAEKQEERFGVKERFWSDYRFKVGEVKSVR